MYSRDERNVKFFVDHAHDLFPPTKAEAAPIVPELSLSDSVHLDRSVSSPAMLDSGGRKKSAAASAPAPSVPAPSAPTPAANNNNHNEDERASSSGGSDIKKKKRHGDRESRRTKTPEQD